MMISQYDDADDNHVAMAPHDSSSSTSGTEMVSEQTEPQSSSPTPAPSPTSKKGLPVFPPAVVAEIVKRAKAGERHVRLAEEYRTSAENIGRWVRKDRERRAGKKGVAASPKPVAAIDRRRNGGALPDDDQAAARAPSRNVVTVVPAVREGTEADRLRQENDELYRMLGRAHRELEHLRDRLGKHTRKDDL